MYIAAIACTSYMNNLSEMLNSPLFNKVGIVTVLLGICQVALPTLVLSLLLTEGGEFVHPIFVGLYGANVAIAYPKLYMSSPDYKTNGMWRRATEKVGRWVPSYWLESADLLEYWRRMFELSREFRRFRTRP